MHSTHSPHCLVLHVDFNFDIRQRSLYCSCVTPFAGKHESSVSFLLQTNRSSARMDGLTAGQIAHPSEQIMTMLLRAPSARMKQAELDGVECLCKPSAVAVCQRNKMKTNWRQISSREYRRAADDDQQAAVAEEPAAITTD